MKYIIVYCTSGLGNRLRSLSSAYAISKKTGRTLKVYWDNRIPNGCLAPWSELFENDIEQITNEEMQKLDDCKVCADKYDADREDWHFKNPTLKILTDKYGAHGKDGATIGDKQKNIVIFNNNFLNAVTTEESYEFIKLLKPKKEIQDKIDSINEKLSLNYDIIGIHARGTDFSSTVEYYTEQIDKHLSVNPTQKFFLSTEDPNYEKYITSKYGDKIIYRVKNNYIKRDNQSMAWNNYNSFSITTEHTKEAVEDLFLLSKTNIDIYHPRSTFSEIARIISKKYGY